MPVPGIAVSPCSPGVNCRVARQEANTAIALGTLQKCPIGVFVVDAACNLHPRLAAVLSAEFHPHLQVSAWGEHRDRSVRLIVPLLPPVQTLAGGCRAAATHCGSRARLRIVHELLGEARWSIISHVYSHLVLAQRTCHPAMTGSARGEERQGQNGLPHPCKLMKVLRELVHTEV